MPSRGSVLLGAAGLAPIMAMMLHFAHFCFRQMRILDDDEYLLAAKQYALRDSKRPIGKDGKVYEYTGATEADFDSDLKISRIPTKGDVFYAHWIDLYRGQISQAFVAEYIDHRINKEGFKLRNTEKIYVVVGKCGQTWGGRL